MRNSINTRTLGQESCQTSKRNSIEILIFPSSWQAASSLLRKLCLFLFLKKYGMHFLKITGMHFLKITGMWLM